MFVRPHLKISNLGMMTCACDLSYKGSVNKRITVQGSLGKNHKTLFEKQVKQKKG
jgi:hypothetical protein